MATRACVVLIFAFAATHARDCMEITLNEQKFTDSIFNGTVLRVEAKNESVFDSVRYNVFDLWERLPRVVVPRNATSDQCRRDGQLYLDSLERMELWALKSRYIF